MRTTRVTLVIPVLNEERQLPWSIWRLRESLRRIDGYDWDLVVVDNGSTDRTWEVAESLQARGEARALSIGRRGRGGALREAWSMATGEILAYMDVDLSTDLVHVRDLVQPLRAGTADVVAGSRLSPGSRVVRGWRRECLSRVFNQMARVLTGSRVRDHQCGFKALTRLAWLDLAPCIEDRAWFFDTELLVHAQRRGWRILEMPVHWVDDPDSRVRIFSTAWQEFRGLWRLRARPARRIFT
ncbi:MAG: glycosyltransferase [Verrucomicrobiales bacterium]|nr:glycosyltransferase [Verrucomicrobiales bacterium]